MSIKIIDIKMISTCSYNLPSNHNCVICRQNLNKSSTKYQEIGKESYIVVGKCGHSYHQECIDQWIKVEKKGNCPMCSKKWEPLDSLNKLSQML